MFEFEPRGDTLIPGVTLRLIEELNQYCFKQTLLWAYYTKQQATFAATLFPRLTFRFFMTCFCKPKIYSFLS